MSAESFPGDIERHEISEDPHEAEDRELGEALSHIWDIAQEFHLDPYPTHFEVVPAKNLNELAAYTIPNRYSHWTFGRAYRQLKTNYDYGLSKIYELVINSNPSQAFLLENNPTIENKFVMAHVLGHTDFFKNNYQFAPTREDQPEVAKHNADRLSEYERRIGHLAVEQTLDATLAIEDHVDPHKPYRPGRDEELRQWHGQAARKRQSGPKKFNEFDDLFDAPKPAEEAPASAEIKMPPEPDRDVLGFIRNHAPYLAEWQRDVIDVVRSDSIYFYPQRRTKIMNEGWAAYWHKRIMREMGDRDLISDGDNETWWKLHSGVVAPNPKQLNPYHFGMTMFEYLEDYYNGNLSEEEQAWLRKENIEVPPRYEGPLKDSPAIPKLREAMMQNDDQSFVRNHFNKVVADRMNMFVYETHEHRDGSTYDVVKESGWQDIRGMLDESMTNCGNPYITVADGDYQRASQLYLRHEYEGNTLDPDYIQKTLPYIYQLWQRPVHMETVLEDKKVLYSYDGKEVTTNELSA